MAKVFVVMGSKGEYSDRVEWLVAGYADEQKGMDHVLKLEAAMHEFYAIPEDTRDEMREAARSTSNYGDYKHPLDCGPKSRGWVWRWPDENRYWLDSVELLTEVPT